MSNNIPTPHIAAKEGEIAETILLPGDPLRAQYIAEHFLIRFSLTLPGICSAIREPIRENVFPSWEPGWDVRRSASIPMN